MDIPTGEVLGGSTIGDSPFCPGGTFRDKHGSEDPSVPPYGLVDRTFRCPDGSLRIGFTPGEPQGRTQAGPWRVASGTGAFKGLRGGGQMKTTYDARRQRHEGSRDLHRDGHPIGRNPASRKLDRVIASADYELLTERAGVVARPGRAVLELTGSEAAEFLQGQVTQRR